MKQSNKKIKPTINTNIENTRTDTKYMSSRKGVDL